MALLLALHLGILLACGAPRADLAQGPTASALQAPAGSATFDHADLALVLAAVDRPSARVDYDAVAARVSTLDRYLAALARVDLARLSAAEREALLINAYNAFTLRLIVEQPTRPASIRDLKDPWGQARWVLAGETLSLDDIEHGLLRPLYKDPRLHFALNCASVGCPPLRPTPFSGAELDAQLEDATRAALGRRQHLYVEGGALHVTRLLDWYGKDFTTEGWSPIASSLPQWLARYGSPGAKALVEVKGAQTPVVFIDYDWSLNDLAR